MFGMPVAAQMSACKFCGEEGDQKVEMKFVCGAEDGLFTKETVGAAGMRTYGDVKAGQLKGAPEIALSPTAICSLDIHRQGKLEHTFRQVRVTKLSFTCSKDADTPPKANLFIVHGWAGDEDLQSVGLCYKRELTIEVTAVEGDLFAKPTKSPAKKKDAQPKLI